MTSIELEKPDWVETGIPAVGEGFYPDRLLRALHEVSFARILPHVRTNSPVLNALKGVNLTFYPMGMEINAGDGVRCSSAFVPGKSTICGEVTIAQVGELSSMIMASMYAQERVCFEFEGGELVGNGESFECLPGQYPKFLKRYSPPTERSVEFNRLAMLNNLEDFQPGKSMDMRYVKDRFRGVVDSWLLLRQVQATYKERSVVVCGEGFPNVSINPIYLIELLEFLSSERLVMRADGKTSPIEIRKVEDPYFRHIFMPLKKSDAKVT